MSSRARIVPIIVFVIAALLATAPPAVADSCEGFTPTHTGTESNDILVGTSGNDVIVGLGGNDQITGAGGLDILCGGAGDDSLTASAGDQPGTLTFDTGLGADSVTLNLIAPSAGGPPPSPGPLGINVFSSGGADVLLQTMPEGGQPGDPVTIDTSLTDFLFNLSPPSPLGNVQPLDITLNGTLSAPSFDSMTLGASPNSNPVPLFIDANAFTFNNGTLTFNGGAGADRITGTNGPDILFGFGGKDRLNGLLGTNTLNGGGGRDRCGNGTFTGCERTLDGAPVGGPIVATLRVPVTSYRVTFFEDARGKQWDYDWGGTEVTCGVFYPGFIANRARWNHPQGKPPKGCPHKTASHPGTIRVTVEDTLGWRLKCTYSGSLPGEGGPCEVVKEGRKP